MNISSVIRLGIQAFKAAAVPTKRTGRGRVRVSFCQSGRRRFSKTRPRTQYRNSHAKRHHSTPYEHFPSAIEMKLTFFFPSLHKTLPSWSILRSLKISPGFTPARVHLPMSSILSLMAGIGTASCAALDTAPLGSWLCPQYDCRRGRAWTEPQHNRVQYWAFNIPHATRSLPKYLVGVSAFHLM